MCEYCDEVQIFDPNKFLELQKTDEDAFMKICKASNGEPARVAVFISEYDLVYSGTFANYCPMCGRDLRGDNNA